MKTTITNEIKIENPNERIIDYCTNHLVMDNPHYNQNKAMGFSTYGIEKKLYLYHIENDALHLPFGLIKDIYPIIDLCATNYNLHRLSACIARGSNCRGRINRYVCYHRRST